MDTLNLDALQKLKDHIPLQCYHINYEGAMHMFVVSRYLVF